MTFTEGASLGLGAINAVGNALGVGQRRQVKQQAKLNAEQVKSQKELAEYQRQIQMQMWHDTNYKAQVGELKEAGLNPALLYGKGGGGGMSVGGGMATGVGSASAEAPSASMRGFEGMSMIPAQIQLMQAQKENIEADTANKQGVDKDLKGAQAQSLLQGIENAKQQQLLTEVQTRLAKLQEGITGATMEDVIDRVSYETERAANEMEIALNEAYISTATKEEKVKIFQQEAIAGMLNNALIKMKTSEAGSNIEVNKAKIKQMSEQIAQGWEGLSISDRQTAIQKFKEEVSANYPNVMNTIGKLIDDGISTIFEVGGKVRKKFKSAD